MLSDIEQRLSVVRSEQRLLLAVSGGGDSLAMLRWFCTQSHWKSRIVAAHVHHGLRDDANAVADLVRRQTQLLGVPLVLEHVDVPSELARKPASIEAVARRLRYEALERLRKTSVCEWIITAHTRDDDAETVLMKLQLSSSWFECTGIPAMRDRILRPFLGVSRAELRSLLSADDLIDDDPMNTDTRHRRVIARQTLQGLADLQPGIVELLADHGGRVRKVCDLTASLVKSHRKNLQKAICGRVQSVEKLPKNLYLEGLDFVWVESALQQTTGHSDFRLAAPQRRQVNQFVRGRAPEASLELPFGYTLCRGGGTCWISGEKSPPWQARADWDEKQLCLIQVPSAVKSVSNGVMLLDPQSLEGSLHVRTWEAGERFRPLNRKTRKISDWLHDIGIHPAYRREWPVIADDNGVVAVPGLGTSGRVTPCRAGEPTLKICWHAQSTS